MQNGKSVNDLTVCKNCGGTKFRRREDLSADEWEIARRFVQEPDTEHSASLFCARCMKPTEEVAATA